MYEYQARLLQVVDGDTYDLELDLGVETSRKIRVRLDGIDAPEKSTALGKQALAWVTDYFNRLPTWFTVNTIKDKTEKYGRYLVKVGTMKEDMIAAGFAKPYDGKGPRPTW
jgi:micrococcal nuclease